jgi:cholera toxin transcriptional activator
VLDTSTQNRIVRFGVTVRILFSLIQIMYLSFYFLFLGQFHRMHDLLGQITQTPGLPFALLVASAVIGIPIRLYTLSATVIGYRELPAKYLKLFPFLVPMDILWALAPFLLVKGIGIVPALLGTAVLLYAPFSQRTILSVRSDKAKRS